MGAFSTWIVLAAGDPVPEDEDVVAGPWGAVIILVLIVATALLMRSFLTHMRRAQAAKDSGVFGDEPAPSSDRDGEQPK